MLVLECSEHLWARGLHTEVLILQNQNKASNKNSEENGTKKTGKKTRSGGNGAFGGLKNSCILIKYTQWNREVHFVFHHQQQKVTLPLSVNAAAPSKLDPCSGLGFPKLIVGALFFCAVPGVHV